MLTRHTLTLVMLLAAATLAGCHGGSSVRRDQAAVSGSAEELLARGYYAEAAGRYEQLAGNAQGATRDGYLMRAADAWFQAGTEEQAINVLRQISPERLRGTDADRYRLLTARAALARGAPRRALSLLDFDGGALHADLYRDWREYRAAAYERLGENLKSVSERVAVEPWLNDPVAIRDNGRAILATLRSVPADELETYRRQSRGNPTLLGWVELAVIVRSVWFEPDRFSAAAADWRRRYPDHAGNVQLAGAGLAGSTTTFERPDQIALLLPLSGRFAGAARAVRDGFLAAWYADTTAERRPVIHIHDVGESRTQLRAAVRAAVTGGANLIVGPIQRHNISTLGGDRPPIPVLALNYVEEQSVGDFFQFGLSPEQEARQAAERARVDAGNRALVLYPADEWGQRLHDAFVERFRELGGIVVSTASFAPTEADYSATLEPLLELDASTARERRLQSVLGAMLEFEPRRRHDVDFVFMAARPAQARSIKPQLRFHRASDLPVYATSHVFSGQSDPDVDRDMDGIVFCDIPWLLDADAGAPDRAQVSDALPGAAGTLTRLYALGIDAYQITPYLDWLGGNPGDAFPGNTGWLSMDAAGRIHRQLLWARFLGGRPRLIAGTGRSLAER